MTRPVPTSSPHLPMPEGISEVHVAYQCDAFVGVRLTDRSLFRWIVLPDGVFNLIKKLPEEAFEKAGDLELIINIYEQSIPEPSIIQVIECFSFSHCDPSHSSFLVSVHDGEERQLTSPQNILDRRYRSPVAEPARIIHHVVPAEKRRAGIARLFDIEAYWQHLLQTKGAA